MISRAVVQAGTMLARENQMTMLRTASAATIALMLAAAPASAQTETTTPAPASRTEGATTPSQPGGMESDAMRQMVREIVLEMMRDGSMREARRDGNQNWKKGKHHYDGGGRMHDRRGGHRDGMRSAMMHGVGMRMMFAIVDADGALSLTEIQDFHGRIFKAVDENGDGKVEMTEIESFFHGDEDTSNEGTDDE